MRFSLIAVFAALFIFLLGACAPQQKEDVTVIGMPNPASVHCKEAGGRSDIRKDSGGQYGVCVFEDGRQCEEWALMRDKRCVAPT